MNHLFNGQARMTVRVHRGPVSARTSLALFAVIGFFAMQVGCGGAQPSRTSVVRPGPITLSRTKAVFLAHGVRLVELQRPAVALPGHPVYALLRGSGANRQVLVEVVVTSIVAQRRVSHYRSLPDGAGIVCASRSHNVVVAFHCRLPTARERTGMKMIRAALAELDEQTS